MIRLVYKMMNFCKRNGEIKIMLISVEWIDWWLRGSSALPDRRLTMNVMLGCIRTKQFAAITCVLSGVNPFLSQFWSFIWNEAVFHFSWSLAIKVEFLPKWCHINRNIMNFSMMILFSWKSFHLILQNAIKDKIGPCKWNFSIITFDCFNSTKHEICNVRFISNERRGAEL